MPIGSVLEECNRNFKFIKLPTLVLSAVGHKNSVFSGYQQTR